METRQLPAAKAWKWGILSQAFSSQLWKALVLWSCYPSVLSLLNKSIVSLSPPHSQLQHSQSDVLSFSPAWKGLSEHIQPLAASLMTISSCSGQNMSAQGWIQGRTKTCCLDKSRKVSFSDLLPCSCQWLTRCWGHSSFSNLRNCILGTALSIVACKTCPCLSSLLQLTDSYLLMAALQFVGMHCWDAVFFQLFPGEQYLYLRLLLTFFFLIILFPCEFFFNIYIYIRAYMCVCLRNRYICDKDFLNHCSVWNRGIILFFCSCYLCTNQQL